MDLPVVVGGEVVVAGGGVKLTWACSVSLRFMVHMHTASLSFFFLKQLFEKIHDL